MWVNFLCIIFSENHSKVNANYELIFRPQKSILSLLKSNLGLWDSIVRICEQFWAELGVAFGSLGVDS